MSTANYALHETATVNTPALLYYPGLIRQNIAKAIKIAGNPRRLWPHVKTHKLAPVVKMQQEAGIERFKCATIAEAEMLGKCGAKHILLAYPLVGTAIPRFILLMQKYPAAEWWAVGDNVNALTELNRQANIAHVRPNLLIDVNMGMNRTGVQPEYLEDFCLAMLRNKNLLLRGFHCYDGHITHPDPTERKKITDAATASVYQIQRCLLSKGLSVDITVMGGTPTFPCHAFGGGAVREGMYFSPGTLFINDYGYASRYTDLPFIPAAALMTRVISHPAPGLFTVDLGYKAISADPPGLRGFLTSLPRAVPVTHSEEHWVFDAKDGDLPAVGTVLYVIPTHICSTTALYDEVLAVQKGEIIDTWKVDARPRRVEI
jgi:D-serine deaminase-like pyridoxal phosphate-dependent protein